MARKNGKTELVAGLVLAHLCGPLCELNGQIYSTAADKNQAALIFQVAAAMVRAEPELAAEVNVVESSKRLVHLRSGSFYQALSSESKTKHGFNPSFVVNDELAQAPNRKLYDTLKTAMGARLSPLMLTISTASDDPNSIMSELVDYGEKVNAGEIDDPSFKAFIFEATADCDVLDEDEWLKANPALGDFLDLDSFRKLALRAKRVPTFEPTFRLLHLNQRVAVGEQFVSRSDWDKNAGQVTDELRARLKARKPEKRCYAGVDLSAVRDLTSVELLFEPLEDGGEDDDKWIALSFAWLPDENLEDRADVDRVPYPVWVKQGHLETTSGKTIDLEHIATRIVELNDAFRVDKLVFDRWRFESLKVQLKRAGVDVDEEGYCVPYGQGFKDMTVALDELERLVVDELLLHGGHPVLRWCMSNVRVVKDDAGNRKFTKKKSKGRIDCAQALAMAAGQFHKEEEDDGGISYGSLATI